jgi:small subunit ribosomal protein S20
LAHHKSALKRIRQTEKRRARNRHIKAGMRTTIKRFRLAVEAGDADAPQKLREAEGAVRRAATKGVIPKSRASRVVSRLAKALPSS